MGRRALRQAGQDLGGAAASGRRRRIIAGGTEITGHFGNPPFQEQELAENPKARIVLNSYDVLGGPSSSTVLFATEKFRKDNPKTYKAFQLALQEAAEFATANPRKPPTPTCA